MFPEYGSSKTGYGYERIPKTVCPNGHDCKLFQSIFSFNTMMTHSKIIILSCAYGVQTEMMSDSKDDALDNDEAEDETEDLTNQVQFPIDSVLKISNVSKVY